MSPNPEKRNPFDPALHGGVKFDHSKDAELQKAPEPTHFRVKFKLKGEKDGPIYEGQKLHIPCRSCPKPSPPSRPPA